MGASAGLCLAAAARAHAPGLLAMLHRPDDKFAARTPAAPCIVASPHAVLGHTSVTQIAVHHTVLLLMRVTWVPRCALLCCPTQPDQLLRANPHPHHSTCTTHTQPHTRTGATHPSLPSGGAQTPRPPVEDRQIWWGVTHQQTHSFVGIQAGRASATPPHMLQQSSHPNRPALPTGHVSRPQQV